MIDYSIIIPHKNIPDLLQRCLDSIPVRDDIQVIVVDDDSDDNKVDFAHYPQWEGEHYEYYVTKEGKGAGYARNVGLKHAKGEWLIFLDADDLLSENAESILEKSIECKEDILFYNSRSVFCDDLSRPSERNFYAKYFSNYPLNKDEKPFRYHFHSLWGKIFKKSFIDKYKICFSETRYANDVYFSTVAGCYASSIRIEDEVFFIVTERTDSLASSQFGLNKPSLKECEIRLGETVKVRSFLKKNGVKKYDGLFNKYLSLIRSYYPRRYFFYLFKFTFQHPSYVIPFFKRDVLFLKEHCVKKGNERFKS